ncbi:Transmembrane protein 11, mitochondrial [Cryptotermes secundus]|uniref:Transmembrane protein 11, mitochondrial n=1 Tax=Cryptotermes secundus TaxID=105785 RepID=A0A2J7R2W2_9NEOP|nr:Transmembrane protein 11, mitochondrial [Cryptotermes secundus]
MKTTVNTYIDFPFNRELDPSKVAVIREVYDTDSAHETFELELERALEAGCSIIVVEPSRLGDETARWIAVGNCLHKTAILSGIGAIATGLVWTDRPYICTPLGALSLLCTGLYTISWQFDPCCQYQVERDPRRLSKLPLLGSLTPRSPVVVLVRRDDSRRKILHTSVSLIAAAFCAWRLYDAYK